MSVFLRKLEFCTGILFLTTNRVSEFDEAILSRIHLLLRYNNLTSDAQEKYLGELSEKSTYGEGRSEH